MFKQSPELIDPNELIRMETCPSCGAEIPRYRDHVVWCKNCNWNLASPTSDKPQSRIEKLYERLGKRSSLRLHQQMMELSEVKHAPSSSRILAFIAATLVHIVTLLVLAVGVALLVLGFPNVVFMIVGALFLLLAWILRPKLGKMPSQILSRDRFPTLYKVIDEIADSLHAPHVAGIILTPDFNASFQQVGWKRSALVRIGIPLFAILDKEQQAAVLAHEIAHGVNGDPMRGLWVGSAVNSLFHWSYLLRPHQIWETPMRGLIGVMTSMLMVIVNLCLLGISNLLWYAAIGFINLIYYDSQRCRISCRLSRKQRERHNSNAFGSGEDVS
ncbi:MAG: M48 family metalloprotease [Caldilineaceae bacterium]